MGNHNKTKKFGKKRGQNQVWTLRDNDVKILDFLYEFREGARATSMIKYLGLARSTVYKRLNSLKSKNFVINQFPVWTISNGGVKIVDSFLRKNEQIFELHNVGYIIKLINKPKWWNPTGTQMRSKIMRIKGYQFKQVDWGKNTSNPYMQLKSDKYIIQMYPESVIILHRKRYLSNNPYDTAIKFLDEAYNLWEWFEERMKFKFFLDGIPQIVMRGNDYNRVNDWMANKIKQEKTNFLVEIGDGRKVWVDLSEPFGKEANTPELQEIMEKRTKDIILNKPLLPSELTQNQAEIGHNLKILSSLVVDKANHDLRDFKEMHGMLQRLSQAQDKMLAPLIKNTAIIMKLNERLDKAGL